MKTELKKLIILKDNILRENRMLQMQKAEKARKVLRIIKSRILDLQVLPNNEIMTNKLFRMVLSENENMKMSFESLSAKQFNIERFIWKNA